MERDVGWLVGGSAARKLEELFRKLDNLTDVEEVVKLSAAHEVCDTAPVARAAAPTVMRKWRRSMI